MIIVHTVLAPLYLPDIVINLVIFVSDFCEESQYEVILLCDRHLFISIGTIATFIDQKCFMNTYDCHDGCGSDSGGNGGGSSGGKSGDGSNVVDVVLHHSVPSSVHRQSTTVVPGIFNVLDAMATFSLDGKISGTE